MNMPLSEEQRDGLQELMNISMGQAANSLARLIETKISLSIPEITSVSPNQLNEICNTAHVYRTRQSFLGEIKGEVINLLSPQGLQEIAELMDYDSPLDDSDLNEVLLDLSNILAGACLNGFSSQLELNTSLTMPTIYKHQLSDDIAEWKTTLVMKIAFIIESIAFDSKVIICLDENSIKTVIQKLNAMLGIED
ncbi:chemotaxis protein CheX [Pseudoalteromonas piscicida]